MIFDLQGYLQIPTTKKFLLANPLAYFIIGSVIKTSSGGKFCQLVFLSNADMKPSVLDLT